MKNYGIDLEKLASELDGTEYPLGAIATCIFEIPEEERKHYLPIGEVQRSDVEDMQDCASRSPTNIYENKFTYAYRKVLLFPENKKFLDDNDCVVWRDGLPYVEFSDAWIAIKSGTTRQGNSLKAPVHACHEWGMVPKKWLPLEKSMTWEQYHDPNRITKRMDDFAKEFKQRFPFNYAHVRNYEFGDAASRGSLAVAGYAWPMPTNGIYERVEYSPNHAFDVFEFTNYYYAFDNYIDSADGDFIKKLAANYKFWDWGYHVIVTAQKGDADILVESGILERLAKVLQSFSLWLEKKYRSFGAAKIPQSIKEQLKTILEALKKVIEGIFVSPDVDEDVIFTPPISKDGLVSEMLYAMRDMEGWHSNPPSRSFRNKNPLNLRWSPGWQLAIGKDEKNFAIFRTVEDGFKTGKNMILNAARGQSKIYKPTDTFYDFFRKYAPVEDSNKPDRYAEYVCKKMGISPKEQIRILV